MHGEISVATLKPAEVAELRDARLSDAAEIAKLAIELGYPSTPQKVRDRLQTMLRDPRNYIVVAEITGAGLVGWMHVFRQDLVESDPFAEIGGLIVTETYRGQGIGSRLVDAAWQWSLGCGYSRLRVRSRIERERAHHFYDQRGFALDKTQLVLSRHNEE